MTATSETGQLTPREQWLRDRQQGLGGSDIAAVAGLSPYQTPADVYYSKTEPLGDDAPSEPMRWGSLLEPVIRQHYAEVTGRSVMTPATMYRHPEHPFLLATVDGVAVDADGECRLLEIKTARTSEGWGEPETDEVPDHYAIQVQHYLSVLGLQSADLAVLVGGSDFRIYCIDADERVQAYLVEIARRFWEQVERREPPDPVSAEDVRRRFPRNTVDDAAEGSDEHAKAWQRLLEIKAQSKALQAESEQLETQLKAAIGERSGIAYGDQTLATWRCSKPSKRFDAKAFAEAFPDLYADFCREVPGARRFLLKQPAKTKGSKQ